MTLPERQIEAMLIEELRSLKYVHREDISDRAALEKNFREHFQSLNRVNLTDEEFKRLLEEIVEYKNDPATATRARFCASYSSSSSATAPICGTSPTITRDISV